MAKRKVPVRTSLDPPEFLPAETRGRKSSFRIEYAQQAYNLTLLGFTEKQLAEQFGVAEKTITNWKQRQPLFLTALNAGRKAADGQVSATLFQRALGWSHPAEKIFLNNKTGRVVRAAYIERYPPDPVSMIFWLKNREAELWRDRASDSYNKATAEEMAAKVREALRAMDAADGPQCPPVPPSTTS